MGLSKNLIRIFFLKFISFYQKYLTYFSFGSCRYYPTCSEFAKIHFENSKISTAIYHTFIRILTCNQLFKGGIDYPVKTDLKLSPKKLGLKDIKYWLVPNQKKRYYIVKNFFYKG